MVVHHGRVCSCCGYVAAVTYFGLRSYQSGAGEVGRERTIDEYIGNLLAVFRLARRVMRDDSCLWVNIGDSYAAGKGASGQGITPNGQERRREDGESLNRACHQIGGKGKTRQLDDRAALRESGLKPGDLCGVPWRFALAMQADGWYLRSSCIWVKALSLCAEVSGSTMPESVNGWRWERCRVKVGNANIGLPTTVADGGLSRTTAALKQIGTGVRDNLWRDCPGCAKCRDTGGYVLRRGSWRASRAHEYIFQFTKTADYYADREAVKETGATYERKGGCAPYLADGATTHGVGSDSMHQMAGASGRNPRDCLWIQPGGNSDVSGKHFALMPQKLVWFCIKASTSAVGVCPKCGAPWSRVVARPDMSQRPTRSEASIYNTENHETHVSNNWQGVPKSAGQKYQEWRNANPDTTLGWRPTCGCWLPSAPAQADWLALVPDEFKPVPATVLDPFSGMATTGVVALQLGRAYIGIELNVKYAEQSRQRLAAASAQGRLL